MHVINVQKIMIRFANIYIKYIFILSLLSLFGSANAQSFVSSNQIVWKDTLIREYRNANEAKIQFDKHSKIGKYGDLPIFEQNMGETSNGNKEKLYLLNVEYRDAKDFEVNFLRKYDDLISENFKIESITAEFRFKYFHSAIVFPYRKDESGKYQLLTNFDIYASTIKGEKSITNKRANTNSVSNLSKSKNLKISISSNGIYKVTYNDLLNSGLISEPINSNTINLYGKKGGMLPAYNTEEIRYDVVSLPIKIYDANDGSFGPNDYFIFYGEDPNKWEYAGSDKFKRKMNFYDTYSYYFIGISENGNNIIGEPVEDVVQGSTININTFNDYLHHEIELANLCETGLRWFGETFSFNKPSMDFGFVLDDVVNSSTAHLEIAAAATSSNGSNTSLNIIANDLEKKEYFISQRERECAGELNVKANFTASSNVNVKLTYIKSNSGGNAYLDYITINYDRELNFRNGQLQFRSLGAIDTNSKFSISNANSNIQIWDISNIYNIKSVKYNLNGDKAEFKLASDNKLHEFIAFDGSNYKLPTIEGIIQPQNLNSLENIEYVVVSAPEFMKQANEISEFHRTTNNYSTIALNIEEIYNEFSSGSKDPSAVRVFLKMLYDKAKNNSNTKPPKYLLLLGDASYDYKNILGEKTNFVPTFQPYKSNAGEINYPIEDGYAYLGDGEGASDEGGNNYDIVGYIDVAVGRLPVKTNAEADDMVEKIRIYNSPQRISDNDNFNLYANYDNWRNDVVFVTDDGIENFCAKIEVDNMFTDYINKNYKSVVVEKIYSDAFKKNFSALLDTYPGVNERITNIMNSGALFLGYLGHSGWDAWSDEKMLTIDDINNKWDKTYSFPIMFSSSCTFSYFDHVEKVSGGELVTLKKHGGAIAIIASSRIAYVNSIEGIQSDFIIAALNKSNGKIPSIGDAFLNSKIKNAHKTASVFMLLGDPGLKVALPKHNVKTTHINNIPIEDGIDTLKAFSKISISGEITDENNLLLNNFNGYVNIKIFDKISNEKTLGNKNNSESGQNMVVEYEVWKNIIYNGKTEVVNGRFSLNFIVPKDIKYNYGLGRISYYAYSENSDANGFFDEIIIGGSDPDAKIDTSAPKVKLYINKNNFINGGVVGTNPALYAEISDNNGINTTGSGIGHDMLLTINGDKYNSIVVNRLFNYNTNSFTEGNLNYNLNLPVGKHTAELKVWNIYNISTTEKIVFEIKESDKLELFGFQNAPNPVRASSYIDFYFTHNGKEDLSHCDYTVYSLTGAIVAKFSYNITKNYGYSVGPMRWNISDANVGLRTGFYICQIRVYTTSGNVADAVSKIMIVK